MGGDDDHPVLVPQTPGPLIRPTAGRQRDELDDLVDEVFGAPDDRGPSTLDAFLIVSGLGAIVLWLLTTMVAWLVVGVVLVLLGMVLPVRSVWRRASGAREARHREALRSVGTPLATADADVARLAARYDALLEATTGIDPELAGRTLAAGHAAVAEVASLLDGARPGSDVERAYVTARIDAIEGLRLALDLVRPTSSSDGEPPRRLVAEARSELDAATGDGSIEQLDALRRELDAER